MNEKSRENVSIHSGHRERMREKLKKGTGRFFDCFEIKEYSSILS